MPLEIETKKKKIYTDGSIYVCENTPGHGTILPLTPVKVHRNPREEGALDRGRNGASVCLRELSFSGTRK